ncbi:hypothetical protein [Promicromonospora sp. NFX87]|uniref:hypothetical protein n=1 Tax=Promicromonospora sp. NFX87 TaxID=3402691 RepID=UPI003AFAAFB8
MARTKPGREPRGDREARKQPGRPPLGDRDVHTLRVPSAHMAHYEAEAARNGYANLNAFFAAQLALAQGLDIPDWARPRRAEQDQHDQQDIELPLGA